MRKIIVNDVTGEKVLFPESTITSFGKAGNVVGGQHEVITKDGVIRHYGVVMGPGGVIFRSVRALCEHYNVPVATYKRRIAAGMTPEEAVAFTGIFDPMGHPGLTFANDRQMCEAYGVSEGVYRTHLKKSKLKGQKAMREALEAAMEAAKEIVGPNGERYKNVHQMCEAYGIPQSTYSRRRARGLSEREALGVVEVTRKPHQRKSKEIIAFDGKTYESLEVLCETYSISVALYKSRIARGFSEEQALTRPKRCHNCFVLLGPDGKQYDNSRELCKAYNVDLADFMAKRLAGASIDAALGL